MKKITFVNLLLVDGNRMLMQLRDNKPEIFAPGVWAIPGGRADEGEDPNNAVAREFLEETDYKVTPKYFRTYSYDFIEGGPMTAFYYDFYDGQTVINCNEGQAMEFKTISELEGLDLFPIHLQVIEDLFNHLNISTSSVNQELTDDDLDEIEDKLLEEEFEDRKEEMVVSGRSVFEIQRLKQEEKKENKDQKN